MKKILKFWLSPKMPEAHFLPKYEKKFKFVNIKLFSFHWFIHPVKRRVARVYCNLLKRFFGLKIIGITGSVGKTTTKDMLFSVLSKKYSTVASKKNIDPVYNIPSSILRCTPFTKYLILEMGVEYLKEMDFYLWMVEVDYAIITSIFPAHTEFLKDIKGVYEEKIKLVRSLKKSRKAFLNNNSEFLVKNSKKDKFNTEIIYFGKNTNISASEIKITDKMSTQFTLEIDKSKTFIHLGTAGFSNIDNALGVSALCYELGLSLEEIKKGLENFKPPEHRMNVKRIQKAIVVDDTYNSNPEALVNALEYVKIISKNKKQS